MGKQVVNTVLDCLVSEIKAKGLGMLKKLPGVKMVANKLVGKAMDKLVANIKSVVDKAIDSAINKLRRRRRASLFGAAKAFASKAASAATAAANAVHGVATKINGLTGGKLSAALQNFVCPAV